MKTTATAAEARQHLVADNGWSDAEVDELFELVGTHDRTHAEWYIDIERFNEIENERKGEEDFIAQYGPNIL